MTEFRSQSLTDAAFERVDLSGSTWREVDLSGSRWRGVELADVRMRDVHMDGVSIEGDVEGLVVNGVDVHALVEAELDRRHPERVGLRALDVETLRAAWAGIEAMWAPTMAAALARPEAELRVRVEDEWSFLETLRHLVFATESWLGAGVLGATSFDPIGLAGDWLPASACGLDPAADPSVAEVLVARERSVVLVRDFLAGATQADLDASSTPDPSVGWPPADARSTLHRVHVILNEEWWHHRYVVRDLAQLP